MGGNETIFMTNPNPTTMTPDQQRIAIAKVRGYTHARIIKSIDGSPDIGIGHHPTEPHSIPDYPRDLNACHEMEKVLTGDQQHDYECHLLRMDYPDWEIKVTHATAAQRAEAFLRTLGLWEETPTQPQ